MTHANGDSSAQRSVIHPHADAIEAVLLDRGWKPAGVRDFLEALGVVERLAGLSLAPRDGNLTELAERVAVKEAERWSHWPDVDQATHYLRPCRSCRDGVREEPNGSRTCPTCGGCGWWPALRTERSEP